MHKAHITGATEHHRVSVCENTTLSWQNREKRVETTHKKSPSPAPLPPLSPSVAVSLSAAVWSMPLCRVLWFSQ